MNVEQLLAKTKKSRQIVLTVEPPGSDAVSFRFQTPASYAEWERMRKKASQYAEARRIGGVDAQDRAVASYLMGAMSKGVKAQSEEEWGEAWKAQDFESLADAVPTLFASLAAAFLSAQGAVVANVEYEEVEDEKKDSSATPSQDSTPQP